MKRLLFAAVLAVGMVAGVSALPRSGEAVIPANWPDLAPSCFDVSGDGYVDLFNDITGVISRYGTSVGDQNYAVLYDVTGGGSVDLFNDVQGTIAAFGTSCSLIDTQVIAATVATMKYQDPAVAFADGYTWGSQYIPSMGIHLYREASLDLPFYDNDPTNLALPPDQQNHQLTRPFGLVYSNAGGNQPGQLIGVWYVVPTPDVCVFHSIAGPCQSESVMPVGFGLTNTDEDNPNPVPFQSAWHTHVGLCVANFGTPSAIVLSENSSEGNCLGLAGGDYWFPLYGWMMHLYNFVPNPDGRFMKWNTNPDLP